MSVVTNIDEDHMDTYGHSVGETASRRCRFYSPYAVLRQSLFVYRQRTRPCNFAENRKPYATYGLDDTADIYATDIENVGAQNEIYRSCSNERT